MKRCSLFLALSLSLAWTAIARGDFLIRSTTVTTKGVVTKAKIESTVKIKGNWRITEVSVDLPALPGGIPLPKSVKDKLQKTATIRNLETGESWKVANGVAQKIDPEADKVKAAVASGRDMKGDGYPLTEASFKNTGKTEKVGSYHTEVWESISASGSVTVWVVPALIHIKQATARGFSPEDKGNDAAIRKAMAVLPGLVVRQRIVVDYGKTAAKSVPPGAKIPRGADTAKHLSLQEVTEVKEITFSEAEFQLPDGVK